MTISSIYNDWGNSVHLMDFTDIPDIGGKVVAELMPEESPACLIYRAHLKRLFDRAYEEAEKFRLERMEAAKQSAEEWKQQKCAETLRDISMVQDYQDNEAARLKNEAERIKAVLKENAALKKAARNRTPNLFGVPTYHIDGDPIPVVKVLQPKRKPGPQKDSSAGEQTTGDSSPARTILDKARRSENAAFTNLTDNAI